MKLKRRRVKRGRVEIIPMIDTIVILLIFYMTFSRFVEASREGAIKLPESRAGDELKQMAGQVIINMFADGKVSIGKQAYPLTDLPGVIALMRKSGPADQKVSIILRGDSAMTYRDLSEFMKAAAKAGVADVTFATLEAAQ
jgi:biopolymer transport protein ExbD